MGPLFLELSEVLYLHDAEIRDSGGSDGIRDIGLLESAVETPRQSFGEEFLHRDLFEMAAAYAFHIAENQPFVDGNKRTGLGAALAFLDVNGVEIPEEAEDLLVDAMYGIGEKSVSKQSLAGLFRRLSTTVPAAKR